MNKTIIITLILLLSFNLLEAQKQQLDSVKKKSIVGIKEKFPRTRILNFEYGQSFTRKFDSELFGETFQNGEIKSQKNFTGSINLPLFVTRKWSLTGSLNYQFNEFEFANIDDDAIALFEQNDVVNFHNFSTAISSTYFSTLFKKPVIYNASLIVDGNNNGFERIKGLVGLSFIMKRTKQTTITLGAIVFIDPTTQLPFFPTFTYNQKFKNSKWELDFILPQRLLFRRFVGENSRLSIGSSFGATGFYVNVDNPNFADVFEYGQLEIKSGAIYEYRFNDYLIGTLQAGLQSFVNSRLTEKAQPTQDFIYENTQKSTGYFQIGFSIDPFTKKPN